jgi:hypothetical protein
MVRLCHHGRVPDWTYHPLRRPMAIVLGESRSRRTALGLVAWIAGLPGGRGIVAGLGHTTPPLEAGIRVEGIRCVSPTGASVGLLPAGAALAALPALGAGLIEMGPVTPESIAEARRALERARGPVAVRVIAHNALEVARSISADMLIVDFPDGRVDESLLKQLEASTSRPVFAAVDGESVEVPSGTTRLVVRSATKATVKRLTGGRTVIVTTDDPSPHSAVELTAAGASMVLATSAGLIAAGPGWFHRTTVAYLARLHRAPEATRTSAAPWMAGLALGLGMIAGGIGATVVALGPVLLPYDHAFLGIDANALQAINPRLIPFLQHDRITLAGTMIAIGILYSSLSWWGIRAGRAWARDALLASGVVGFPTLFYFFAYRYVEPVHVVLAAVLFPLFVIATWSRPRSDGHVADAPGPDDEWQRALAGQLLMVATGFGLIAGGLSISFVGLSAVFVPADLGYMSTSAHALASANDRLISFIAHDRAGFGGALVSTGVAVFLMAAWGWQRGESWVWWTLALAASVGFGAALAIHLAVGYLDFLHLLPIYAGIAVSVTALSLSKPFLAPPRRAVTSMAAEHSHAGSAP